MTSLSCRPCRPERSASNGKSRSGSLRTWKPTRFVEDPCFVLFFVCSFSHFRFCVSGTPSTGFQHSSLQCSPLLASFHFPLRLNGRGPNPITLHSAKITSKHFQPASCSAKSAVSRPTRNTSSKFLRNPPAVKECPATLHAVQQQRTVSAYVQSSIFPTCCRLFGGS